MFGFHFRIQKAWKSVEFVLLYGSVPLWSTSIDDRGGIIYRTLLNAFNGEED